MRKSLATAAVAASLFGGSLAGAALFTPTLASAQDATETPTESTTEDATPDADRSGWVTDALAPLVTDGTITQAQADAVVAALDAARPAGRGFGHHGRGLGASLSAAATAVGVTEDELRTALRSGDTLAEVAAANGVEVQAVVDALVAAAGTRIDEEVAEGDLTEEQATELRAGLAERVTALVNGEAGFGRGFGGRGFGHRHGPDADATDDAASDAAATATSV